jgi:hypothetical protein
MTTTMMRGWFHIKRYIYDKVLQEVLEPYVTKIIPYGQTLDISVVDMPKSLYYQFNRLIDAEGLKEYEK